MRETKILLLISVFLINLISGCDSQHEKEQKAAEERKKKVFGTWDKDVEELKNRDRSLQNPCGMNRRKSELLTHGADGITKFIQRIFSVRTIKSVKSCSGIAVCPCPDNSHLARAHVVIR